MTDRLADPEAKPGIDQLNIPVSPGELLDKISILRLKAERMTDAVQLQHVNDELQLLQTVWQGAGVHGSELAHKIERLREQLQTTNSQLWDIEDRLRELEARKNFGAAFIELARQVYLTNDRRAAVKKQINELLGSRLQEEKSYRDYQ